MKQNRQAYDFKTVEARWQKRWEESKAFVAANDPTLPKYYALIEFPYPSGQGLHVGHPRSYTALDVIARRRRMQGYNVLFPIGWDAFGLPTENFAIKTGQHPRVVTDQNVTNFRRQLQRLGCSFDWSREIDTTDPAYLKWTQWIFLRLFARGLAYKAEVPVNWCTSCKVGLANEEVVGGVCERCDGEVIRKTRRQWMLGITRYAQRLLDDLETVDYPDKVKAQQRHWIGRSEGIEIDFEVLGQHHLTLRVFTTRPDTLFGATYLVVAPEHSMARRLLALADNRQVAESYREQVSRKSEFERAELAREVTGVPLDGVFAINPVNGVKLPVWMADYVLASYGTGAVMAVPAHDERDWRFARKFDLPIIEVVTGGDVAKRAHTATDLGTMTRSEFIDGLRPSEAVAVMTEHLEKHGCGKRVTKFKLRDWVFSRQRYWGEPIPLIECHSCGFVPVPEAELPVTLPEIEHFQTTETGESPLASLADWVNVACPKCQAPARRETDTMPQWAGSSWYYLRYTDPHNDTEFAARKALDYWLPVDWYNGGMEHTTLHLLYSRFWHKFLYDEGLVSTSEPYAKRTSHGLVLGENQAKMSKTRGNVVNPDALVDEYGADAFRLYELFMGAFDEPIPWSTRGLTGMHRFLKRVWALADKVSPHAQPSAETRRVVHTAIEQIERRLEATKFNTAVAALMELCNHLASLPNIRETHFECLVLLLAPFAPHMAEELWESLGHQNSLANATWPRFDPALTIEEMVEVPIQVNGKIRASLRVPRGITAKELESLGLEEVQAHTANKRLERVRVVGANPPRLLTIAVARK